MTARQAQIIEEIASLTRLTNLFGGHNQQLYALLTELAYSNGYSDDPVDGPDYGIYAIGELMGPPAKPLLERLGKKMEGQAWQYCVREAIRRYC